MDKIRAKYKDNRQKQQEEIMKLYQDRQINPFGSCFPLLVQMPIFITMFYVIRNFGSTHESFTSGGLLWFKDLSVHDPYYVLPILSAVTMLAASEITAKSVDPQQRWIMRILPVVFTVFLLNFPAGLFMYWIPSNLVTLVQNYVIYHHGPGRKGSDKVETRGKSPDNRKSVEKPAAKNESDRPQQRAAGASRSRRRRKKKR